MAYSDMPSCLAKRVWPMPTMAALSRMSAVMRRGRRSCEPAPQSEADGRDRRQHEDREQRHGRDTGNRPTGEGETIAHGCGGRRLVERQLTAQATDRRRQQGIAKGAAVEVAAVATAHEGAKHARRIDEQADGEAGEVE